MLSFIQFLSEATKKLSPKRALSDFERLRPHISLEVSKRGKPSDQMMSLVPQASFRPFRDHKGNHMDYEDSWDAIENHGKVRNVPIKSIVSRQSTVSGHVVSKKITNEWPDHKQNPPMPYFIHSNGVHMQVDGNHRTNASIMRDAETMRGKVFDLDTQEIPEHLQSNRPERIKKRRGYSRLRNDGYKREFLAKPKVKTRVW